MRCLSVSAGELQRIALADWSRFIQRAVTSQNEAEAMEKLLAIVEPYANAA